jgi:hypothetical protein
MSNTQLTDIQFLKSFEYEDNYYLENLCRTLWEFIKNVPVPVFTSLFHNKNNELSMKLAIGEKFIVYRIDNTISYFDFIYRFKKFAMQFYPQFEYEEEIEVELETDEMLKVVADKGLSLNDVVFLTKKKNIIQKGIILKVFLAKDEFLFEYNNEKTIRTSSFAEKLEDVLPVRIFLQNVRKMYYDKTNGKLIKDYIFNNSKVVQKLPLDENEVTIDYPSHQMKSFFKIHYDELQSIPFEKITSLVYKWGKFKIVFENETNEHDCISYFRKRKNVRNGNIKED